MRAPILKTKIYIPPSRPYTVLRPRLSQRLTVGVHGKLTLISAPAGFGKTTLVSAWIHGGFAMSEAAQSPQIAWLSLDEADNDPNRFLTYFVAALQTVSPQRGEVVLTLLQSSQPPPIDSILTVLLNEVTAIADKVILVLDDYHVLNAPQIDHILTFVLDHLPPRMHIVITTREDPPLPLARYRARGQLTEVRAADLRFTRTEATDFLNKSMTLALTAEDVATLATRTEGWIAGLQMAALALQGARGIPEFISAFAGDARYIADYLVDEVLQQQPEQVRSFLLQTAILDRLSGPLCNAIADGVDGVDGGTMLATLERRNLFVVPLDDKREWYRYHHLFADVLQMHAQAEQPVQVSERHRRASAWYEENDQPFAAVRHALAAADFERAADLIELARPTIEQGRRDVTFRGWVEALPDELVWARPVLNVGYALALQDASEFADAAARLQAVEQWLESGAKQGEAPAPMVVVDKAQLQALPASIATAQVMQSLATGDIPGTITRAPQALERIPAADHLRRGQVIGLLGLAQWARGDLEAAQQAMAEAGALTQKAGTILDIIPGIFVTADIEVVRSQLREAVAIYEHALQLAAEHNVPTHLGIAKVYAGLSELYCERGDLDAATQALATSKTLGERLGDQVWRHRWHVAQARLNEAQGDLASALDQLHKAEQLYALNPLSNVRPIAALKTRVWLKQGRLTAAEAWVRDRSLSTDDELSYAREFEHITLARVLIAQYKNAQQSNTQHRTAQADSAIHEALQLLTRLRQAATAGGRIGCVIEILVTQALAHEAQGDIPAALDALEQALKLAEPEGYVRTFVDEGAPMRQLLRAAVSKRIMPGYTSKLLAAFEAGTHQSRDASSPLQPLIEPLSARELDVLRLFNTELSGPEIADKLVVALSTVRTHTKSIYSKLNVNNRRAAVIQAEKLDLI